MTDPEALERAAAFAVDHFGALHIAVNNAGIVNGGPMWELPLEEWRRVLDVNLWGVIHGVRAFVPRIIEAGAGHVVNISSMAAFVPYAGVGPYTVAKHGVLGLSEVLAAELDATGLPIGVSVVFPGMFKTGMSPVGGDPRIVAINVLDSDPAIAPVRVHRRLRAGADRRASRGAARSPRRRDRALGRRARGFGVHRCLAGAARLQGDLRIGMVHHPGGEALLVLVAGADVGELDVVEAALAHADGGRAERGDPARLADGGVEEVGARARRGRRPRRPASPPRSAVGR